MEIDNITATENITNFVYQSIPRGEVLPLSVVTDPEIKEGYTHTLAIDKYDFRYQWGTPYDIGRIQTLFMRNLLQIHKSLISLSCSPIGISFKSIIKETNSKGIVYERIKIYTTSKNAHTLPSREEFLAAAAAGECEWITDPDKGRDFVFDVTTFVTPLSAEKEAEKKRLHQAVIDCVNLIKNTYQDLIPKEGFVKDEYYRRRQEMKEKRKTPYTTVVAHNYSNLRELWNYQGLDYFDVPLTEKIACFIEWQKILAKVSDAYSQTFKKAFEHFQTHKEIKAIVFQEFIENSNVRFKHF